MKWSTSDETIAKVDEHGVLHCLSPGTVVLTGDGDANADIETTLHIVSDRGLLRIPQTVSIIESEAFSNTSFEILQLPPSVISVDDDAFIGTPLDTIILLGDKPHLERFAEDSGLAMIMSEENQLWVDLEAPYLLFGTD